MFSMKSLSRILVLVGSWYSMSAGAGPEMGGVIHYDDPANCPVLGMCSEPIQHCEYNPDEKIASIVLADRCWYLPGY